MIPVWILSMAMLAFTSIAILFVYFTRKKENSGMGYLGLSYLGFVFMVHSGFLFLSQDSMPLWQVLYGSVGISLGILSLVHYALKIQNPNWRGRNSVFLYVFSSLVFYLISLFSQKFLFDLSFGLYVSIFLALSIFLLSKRNSNIEYFYLGLIFLVRILLEIANIIYHYSNLVDSFNSSLTLIPNFLDLGVIYLILFKRLILRVQTNGNLESAIRHYFHSFPYFVLVLDRHGFLIDWNRDAQEFFNLDQGQSLKRHWNSFVVKKEFEFEKLDDLYKGKRKDPFYIELWQEEKVAFWSETHIQKSNRKKNGGDFNLVFIRDITGKRMQEEMLQFQAWHDLLTGFYNRKHFFSILQKQGIEGEKGFLCLFDIKKFETLNSEFSHGVGDRIIVNAAEKIHRPLPKSSRICRYGTDQFLVHIEKTNLEQITEYVSQVQGSFELPLQIGDLIFQTQIAIGVTQWKEDQHISSAISDLEMALREAKKAESSCFVFFSDEVRNQVNLQKNVLHRMPEALHRGEFINFFQPIYSLDPRKVVQAEVLVRWRDSQNLFIAPDTFIASAEKSGLILSLGASIFENACETLGKWKKKGHAVTLSVNISPQQIPFAFTKEYVSSVLKENGLNGRDIELELTERFLLQDTKGLSEWLQEIQNMGISISLDDFGTGYSSLSYLRKFSIQKLKLDKSFVQNIDSDPAKQSLVRAILGMAKSFQLKTTAEGIESEQEADYLHKAGVNFFQGYLLGRPAPLESFEKDVLLDP